MAPDFKKIVIETVAKRAAFRCSNPDCRVTTVGPNADPEKSTTIGEAAHISGARPGGARFDASLSDVVRASVTNAIWLCRNCHKLIDADADQYPSEHLFAWREEHENYLRLELGTSTDRRALNDEGLRLAQFDGYPPVVRRIVIDKPDGWEWRLTAELMKFLNEPYFRKLRGLREGLYHREQTDIAESDVLDWLRNRLSECSALVAPPANLINRLGFAWGKAGEIGDVGEIHHICRLLRDSLSEIVTFEERLHFANVPEAYEKSLNLLKGVLGSQIEKLGEIPRTLDEVIALIGSDDESDEIEPRVIKKSIDFQVPEGWEEDFARELKRAVVGSRPRGHSNYWLAAIIVVILIWIVF